jgi:myo-inositol-1-phosphate synthase
MGPILDSFSAHMGNYDESRTVLPAKRLEPSLDQVARVLKKTGVDVLANYLPVGSEQATCLYAERALEAGCAFVNNIPVFIASDDQWAKRFETAGLPIIGDDIKAQVGATITHRTLVDLFKKRGVKLERTYQLNTGGNYGPASYFCRHPPRQHTDDEAHRLTEEFIDSKASRHEVFDTRRRKKPQAAG